MSEGKRVVEKNPQVPNLNKHAIELLSELCFRTDDAPVAVDLIFFYSTLHDTEKGAQTLIRAMQEFRTDQVFVSGGHPEFEYSDSIHKAEADLILDQINEDEFPEITFYKETKSTNTYENVSQALEVLDFRDYDKILFVGKSHAAGRDYLTLRKFCPKATMFQKTYPVVYDTDGETEPLKKDNWFKSEFGRSRVWGEFLRIITYGRDMKKIEYNEVSGVVEQISKDVQMDI